ncbi:glycosyltransferase [Poriferisphaera sp. WC338]|uniref:glycosyltransferase n=1 Tax=Poriferisphaera sp. WC338 TaxID=3425129 RepID=UPI003D81681D
MTARLSKKLAIIGGKIHQNPDGKLLTHVSFGAIVNAFSERFEHIYLSSAIRHEKKVDDDYVLPRNITYVTQPPWTTTINSTIYHTGIVKSYDEAISQADAVFVRGNPVAATKQLYKLCAQQHKPICHWLVGNPMALLQSHQRSNWILDTLGKLYIWGWERRLVGGRKKANGVFLCNGQEISDRYPSEQTHMVVSTTLTKNDFFKRVDTCQNNEIKILTMCYIRPEKGIEYLIDAYARTKIQKRSRLILAGSRARYDTYQKKLDQLIEKHNLQDNVEWRGHIRHDQIPSLLRECDVFVLPTLSEGTPRVLVEARANSLPIISTNVGGIPSSVTDEVDGLLVPPKNPFFLAEAMTKVCTNHTLRRKLILNGYQRATELTVDKFVDLVINCLDL